MYRLNLKSSQYLAAKIHNQHLSMNYVLIKSKEKEKCLEKNTEKHMAVWWDPKQWLRKGKVLFWNSYQVSEMKLTQINELSYPINKAQQ